MRGKARLKGWGCFVLNENGANKTRIRNGFAMAMRTKRTAPCIQRSHLPTLKENQTKKSQTFLDRLNTTQHNTRPDSEMHFPTGAKPDLLLRAPSFVHALSPRCHPRRDGVTEKCKVSALLHVRASWSCRCGGWVGCERHLCTSTSTYKQVCDIRVHGVRRGDSHITI